MTKWAHLAHDAHGGYFFSPCRQNRAPVSVVIPPLEQATEGGLLVQKSPALAQNSVEWADNSVAGDSGCSPKPGNRILVKNR
jgi:hypothetical protein